MTKQSAHTSTPSAIRSFCILGFIAIVIGIFSYNTVWLGDDLNYAYSFSDERHDYRVESAEDIIESLNAHYFKVNGRYAAHCLIQLFCGPLGHIPFAVANGLVYVAFILLICKNCKISLYDVNAVLSVCVMALMSFMTKMMPSCQICYIWMFTLVLLWLYVFFNKSGKRGVTCYIVAGLFSVIAGNGQEGISIGICCADSFIGIRTTRDLPPCSMLWR